MPILNIALRGAKLSKRAEPLGREMPVLSKAEPSLAALQNKSASIKLSFAQIALFDP